MTYLDPFRDATISPARIDAGVDYCGSGPVYPIGAAVIVRRGTPSNTSTFGSDLSAYRLLDGPAKGLVVFFAEHYQVEPGISTGQTVGLNTVLWRMNGGCIEIGWATDDGSGSKAWSETNYQEGELSALGKNFNDLLTSLGTVSGLTLGRSVTGTLPPGWPTMFPTEDEMAYEDFKKGAQLYKDGKHLPGKANADVVFGWNLAQRSAHLPDTSGHVHMVTVAGQTVQTSKPD